MGKSAVRYNMTDFSVEEMKNVKDALRYVRYVFNKHDISLSPVFLQSSKEISKSCSVEINYRSKPNQFPSFDLPF